MWYKECNLEILHVGFKIKLVLHQHRHFHPSGNTEPSEADLIFTKRMEEAGNILGIDLLDHIIVSGKEWLSLREYGLL